MPEELSSNKNIFNFFLKTLFKTKKTLIIALIGLICLIVVTNIAYSYGYNNAKRFFAIEDGAKERKIVTPTPQLKQKTEEYKKQKEYSIESVDLDISDYIQINWQSPSKMNDLNLFQQNEDYSSEWGGYLKTDYYKVANFVNGDELILAVVELKSQGGNYYRIHRFIKREDDYIRLARVSTELDNTNYRLYEGINFKNSDSFFSSDFFPDEEIIKGSTKLTSFYREWFFEKEGSGDLKVGTTKWGDIFIEKDEDGIQDSNGQILLAKYYIKLKDSTILYYSSSPIFIRDDRTFDISWKDDSNKGIEFSKMSVGGCGGGGFFAEISNISSSISSFKEVGISSEGSKVYFIDNKNDQLVNYSYQFYAKNSKSPSSIEDFIDGLGLVFWKDDFGSIIPYVNSEFTPPVECAKPVIYLYPEKETEVTVKVGADITESDPQYRGSWEVIAEPNGQLFINDVEYPYLFWEGLGFGLYPEINKGFVIEREKVKETIKEHLDIIGLNGKEIDDFLEFWLPLMPENKFIRLSWLQNNEMAELAPLTIYPQPKSVIRVFLDFEGLDQFIDFPKQELKKIERDGFTVVEWGGLRKADI